MNIGDRIKIRLEALGLKGADVTRALKLKSSGTITQWMSGKEPKGENLIKLAKFLDCSVEWLITGKGSQNLSPTENQRKANEVPLISFVRAGELCDAEDPYSPGDGEEFVEIRSEVKPGMYALRVVGDSMTKPSGIPSFPDGIIIAVDPHKQAENGSNVIARDDEGKVTFKKLSKEPSGVFLLPLNPDYKPIEIKGKLMICGVVVEAFFQC